VSFTSILTRVSRCFPLYYQDGKLRNYRYNSTEDCRTSDEEIVSHVTEQGGLRTSNFARVVAAVLLRDVCTDIHHKHSQSQTHSSVIKLWNNLNAVIIDFSFLKRFRSSLFRLTCSIVLP